MRSVLVVAHGSRVKETEESFTSILDMVKQKLPDHMIEPCYMQLADQTLELSVASLVDRGATEIRIVPYFLFTGVHIKKDIPQMIAGFQEQYPNVEISLGQALGVDERLADILVDRIVGAS
ncbi:MAG: sirohydrochlorin cobaltochelatase [Coriobacteriia bacterium]|nr:sirohydrochlorin cobaltochelatase [Coriobacteriia bacterium]